MAASLGLKSAFQRYNAQLKNVQWSNSAWTPDGRYLVVSLGEHHCRKSAVPGALEFKDSASRWNGHGNVEFRRNLEAALKANKPLRLVIAHAQDPDHIEAGKEANKVKKEYDVREELIGEVVSFDAESGDYVIRFTVESMPQAVNI